MTYEEWKSLKEGDWVCSAKSGTPRKIHVVINGSIALKKIRKSEYPDKFSWYDTTARSLFKIHFKNNDSCYGCKNLNGRHCILETGNHCIRRAEDYYERSN